MLKILIAWSVSLDSSVLTSIGVYESSWGWTVDSEITKGTTFHVYFPAIIEEIKTPVEAEEEKPLPTGIERIITVGDESTIVALHNSVLSRLGYTVTAKTIGTEVLSIRPDMPIILYTGYNSIISEEKTLEIGIKKFLLKPVDRNDLAKAVRSVLDEN